MEEKKGLSLRHKWFISHINMDEEYLYKYQHSFKNTILELKDVSDQTRIMIWACENSDEQTAQRFILSLLKNKKNDIFLINLVGAYKEIFAKSDSEYFPLHTGELSSEELNVIYEKNKTEQPLTLTERKRYEQEWEEISNQSKNLRIWKDRKIHSVGEDYYDRFIINTAKALHKKHNNKDFMKSARLIGEIIGHLNQKIGDEYFEYRLIQLVLNGVFEIEGVPKAMRFYSVKLHEKYRS
ncbi:DUF3658 domain-containing protein [Niallia alba]|uniref:DUF3658 domain-containing protein n=1 Tax=Niallia alba TaxID=2729105 RepID=UPI002E251248|nr:DUF3658 domain-containing protein [Niallia alba]